MPPSTLIYEPDRSRVEESINSAEDLRHFTHLAMKEMTNSDFHLRPHDSKRYWSRGDAVYYDPDPKTGFAIYKVNSTGLRFLLQHSSELAARYQADLQAIAEFVAEHGASDIYEFMPYE